MADAHGELRGMIADVPPEKRAGLMATLIMHQAHKLSHPERCKAIGKLLCAVRTTAALQIMRLWREGITAEEIAEMIPSTEVRLACDLLDLAEFVEKLS